MSQRRKPPRTRVAIPAANALKDSDRVPAKSPIVLKALDKVSRAGLFELVQTWLQTDAPTACAPLLAEDAVVELEGDYAPVETVKELRELYEKLEVDKTTKSEVVDRVLEGDWRHGISLYQLATVDMQHLAEHPTFLTWKAYKIVLRSIAKASDRPGHKRPRVPQLDTSSMIKSIQPYLAAMARAYCSVANAPSPAVKILRVQIFDTPYSASRSHSKFDTTDLPNSSITVYTAIPEKSDHIFMASKAERGGGLLRTFQPEHVSRIIIDALARGISKQYERYTFKSASLSSKNLEALVAQSTSGSVDALGGGWSFTNSSFERTPLQLTLTLNSKKRKQDEPTTEEAEDPEETATSKRHRAGEPLTKSLQSRARPSTEKGRAWGTIHFRQTAFPDDGKGLENFSIRIEEPFPLPTTGPVYISPTDDTFSKPSERFQKERPWSTTKKFGPGHSPTPTSKALPYPKNSAERSTTRPRQYSASSPPSEPNTPHPTNQIPLESLDSEPPAEPQHEEPFCPMVQISFHGTHVFAGIRTLVEREVIDGKKMPGWMTGSEGVSRGVVKDGKLLGEDDCIVT